MKPIIKVEGLGKQYHIGAAREPYKTMRESVSRAIKAPFRRLTGNRENSSDTIWALKNLSFAVNPGEVVGVIGRNGAGKSTLLKVLSRITEPTTGQVDLYGRVASLLEVGTGFHPELTGRENIYLNGAILGMGKREIVRKFDEIIDFAEVEKFIETPVKRYSSGMYLRLAFAVAAHMDPEILLVDEVLAVGDSGFQKKCLGKMDEVAKDGRTVIFVSHHMTAVRQLSRRCIWLDKGQERLSGLPGDVINSYLTDSDNSEGSAECAFEENTAKDFQLRMGRLVNNQGLTTQTFECDEPVIIELFCQVHRRIQNLLGYLTISRMDGVTVLESDSFDAPPNALDGLPVGEHSVKVTIPARTLAPGDYSVYVNFTSMQGTGACNVDSPGTIVTFRLDDSTTWRGNRRSGYFSTLIHWESEPALTKLAHTHAFDEPALQP
ncbi:MAG: ABC transporter ATP-binding protein, partial [Blastocatellia bacterium]